MISGIGAGVSSLQSMKALNAFKMDEKIVQKATPELEEFGAKEELNLTPKTDMLRTDVSNFQAQDIKQYAQAFDSELTNSDINYGVTYGRSVIVDYSA